MSITFNNGICQDPSLLVALKGVWGYTNEPQRVSNENGQGHNSICIGGK